LRRQPTARQKERGQRRHSALGYLSPAAFEEGPPGAIAA
jgi:hypothetical protein